MDNLTYGYLRLNLSRREHFYTIQSNISGDQRQMPEAFEGNRLLRNRGSHLGRNVALSVLVGGGKNAGGK